MTNPNVNLEQILSWKPADRPISWNRRDAIIYALGVGEKKDLCFLYEKHPSFEVLPTLWCAVSFKGESVDVVDFNASSGSYPGLKFDPAQILHGEEYIEVLRPMPTKGGRFLQRTRTLDFLDKGSGGLLVSESVFVDAADPSSAPFARLIRTSFIRGLGNHGGRKRLEKDPRPSCPSRPSRAPDVVEQEVIDEQQALLYRLSGDYNPLHADPNIAKSVGFERPILHGLCSLGHATRAVIRATQNGTARQLKSVRCRFTNPVLPGQTLETRMWKEGHEWIVFECAVNGKVVLDGAAQINASKL